MAEIIFERHCKCVRLVRYDRIKYSYDVENELVLHMDDAYWRRPSKYSRQPKNFIATILDT